MKNIICVLVLVASSSAQAELNFWWTSEKRDFEVSDKTRILEIKSCKGEKAIPHVFIDPDNQYQEFQGWGASITDSAANVIGKLPEKVQEQTLNQLFNSKEAGINWLRVPIGATDFSADNRSCDDPPSVNEKDPQLKYFSLERCTSGFLPMLKRALKLRPDMKLIASPWSAPAWMKDKKSMVGGKLMKENFPAYADYLIRFFKEMSAQGIKFEAMSVINEPFYDGLKYPHMFMSAADQIEFISKHLGPKMQEAEKEIGKIKILAYDHNANRFDWVAEVLKSEARPYISGIAYHGYNGPASWMETALHPYPDMGLYLTEFSLGGWVPAPLIQTEYTTRGIVMGGIRAGAKALVFWNLALDPKGGNPTNNGCDNCQGVVTVSENPPLVKKNVEFLLFSHLAKLVHPDKGPVHRVASYYAYSSYAFERYFRNNIPEVDHVAFKDSDGQAGVLLFNPADQGSIEMDVKFPGECKRFRIPANAIVSIKQKK